MAFDLLPDADVLGPSLHRSFRASMDGPVSVILFNAVQALPDETWSRFVRDLAGRFRTLGRFDADALRRSAPVATGAMERKPAEDGHGDGGWVGPRTMAVVRMFRAGLRLVEADDWVLLASEVRMSMRGDPDLDERLALSRDLAARTDGEVSVRTVLTADGLDLAHVASRDFRKDGRTVRGWVVEAPAAGCRPATFGDHAEAVQAARDAISSARVDAMLAAVDVARLAANAASFTPPALDPADPADAALLASPASAPGSGGLKGLLYRRRSAAGPGVGAGDAVEYLFGGAEDGRAWLQGWRVRLSRVDGSSVAVEESFRSGEHDVRERMSLHGHASRTGTAPMPTSRRAGWNSSPTVTGPWSAPSWTVTSAAKGPASSGRSWPDARPGSPAPSRRSLRRRRGPERRIGGC